VSLVVHSLPSLQAPPGVQLPVQAPLTQACATHCLQVPLAPPPQVVVVWLATGTQVVPLQQPPTHEVESHAQLPLAQRCPVEQAFPQVPQLPLSVWGLVQLPLHAVCPAGQLHWPV
jgi:hypothetical protein